MTAAFAVGATIRTRRPVKGEHSRLPTYLAEKRGRVIALAGSFASPAMRARGVRDAAPQTVYTVLFDANELWGNDGDQRHTVAADLWESDLESAT